MLGDYKYEKYNESAKSLANRVIRKLEKENELQFPMDPFMLLNKFNIKFKLMNFEGLEGIYIVPINENEKAVVGINKNRPITRQRFTAAHEICHHIKDRETIYCLSNAANDPIEKFADEFASELLAPSKYLKEEVNKYINNGFVSFENALKISIHFGISFESCIYALAYRLRVIDGDIDSKILKARIIKFKPNSKIQKLKFKDNSLELTYQLLDSYTFISQEKKTLTG